MGGGGSTCLWAGDRAYSDLMRELWGSPGLWNVKRTYIEVARRLGVDEETVRNRIKHMRDSGFLLGWRIIPNPALLHRSNSFLFLELEDHDAKDETISRLCTMDGVIVIASFYGPGMLVTLLDDEQKSSEREILQMGIRAETFTTPGMQLPSLVPFRMTVTDWRIVRLLISDAERRPSDISRELKLSTKTVNRRLGGMMDSRAVFNMPIVNLKAAGGISYQMIVRCKEEARTSEVEGFVASRIQNLVFRAATTKRDLIFGFNGINVAEGDEILKFVKKLPMVRSVQMNIVENVVHVYDWLAREVESQLRSAGGALEQS